MERRNFLKTCCYTLAGGALLSAGLQSCGTTHYATVIKSGDDLKIAKSEFWEMRNDKKVNRSFVLLAETDEGFPICVQKIDGDKYIASLMKCTHRGCELNVGGGIYTCPCHGSEFSLSGKVLEGPADTDLKTYETKTDDEYIYILSA